MKISVVLPVYHIDEQLVSFTKECLESIKGEYQELIIVDDASPISLDWLKKVSTKYIKNTKNIGFVKSANKGMRKVSGDFTILVCNDTQLIRGNLKDLCKPQTFVFPKIVNKDLPFWDGAFYGFPSRIGLYNARYDNYFADLDLFYRKKKEGIKLEKNENVVVYHHKSQTTEKLKIRNSSYEQGHKLFIKRFGFDPLENYYNLL